jgi:signal transduction histidine kinase
MANLVFSVDSALLNELGEKLVETVHVALIELVKNSYDADATDVTLRFVEKESGAPEVQVIDNGTGMTFDEVKKYWMRIATTIKAKEAFSKIYGRPVTGSKGIGRFSCRRLGNRLKLKTIAQKMEADRKTVYEKTEVSFPWTKFAAGSEVTKIKCPGHNETVGKTQTGTTLIMDGAAGDEWSKRGWDFLKRQLAVLVANRGQRRPGYKEDPGFNIYLDVPRYEGDVIDLREKLISAGWGTLTAKIDESNRADCQLDAKGIGTKRTISKRVFSYLKDINLKIGIIPDKKTELRNVSVLSMGTMRKILPRWGGVQIRYKGFRVYPFGDDDWLDLDYDRSLRKGKAPDELFVFAQSLKGVDPGRTLLQLLSMRSHVGSVEIGPKATGFEMKANREGFLHSEAVSELKEFVRYCIDWATIHRDHYIRSKKEQDARKARKDLETTIEADVSSTKLVEKAVDYISDEMYRISTYLPRDEKTEVKKRIKTATEAIIKHEERSKEELQHLRLVASTSTLLLIFAHEVKSLLGNLEASSGLLKSIEKKLKGADSMMLKEVRADLQNSKDRLIGLIDMTSLIGFRPKEVQPSELALYERIKTAERCFKLILDDYSIELDFSDVPKNIITKSVLEAELYVIIFNILSNSIKAVIAAGSDKKISISAIYKNGNNIITFRDMGVGLSERQFEDVFIPFVADPGGELYKELEKQLNPEDKFIVGAGSGLGLGIVKEILENRGGQIRFKTPEGIWGAELEIVIS